MTVDFSDILRTHAESMQSEGFYTVANALNRAADEHERKDHALDFGAKLVSELSKKIEDMCARVAASEQDAAQWKARESETQEALQAIGEEFGVLGGEPRVDGIRRVLIEQRDTISRVLREAAEDGWRPIETAPKDGTNFLAANDEVLDVCWATTTDRGEPAWAFAVAAFPFDSQSDERPTHWRPLPPPPTGAATQSLEDGK